jgi:putative phage-type endonuclease
MSVGVLVPTKNMDKEVWKGCRRRGIGGSDVAGILGLSRFKSPMSVYLDKIGELPDSEPGEAAYWGTIHEPAIASEYAKRHPEAKIQRKNAILQHPEYPFMLANIDRYILDPKRGRGVLEIKTASEWLRGKWEDDHVPDEYMLQLQHYLAVTGLEWGAFAVLIGGNTYKEAEVTRDQELIDGLIHIESEFWKCVEAKTPPPIDGSPVSADLLTKLYPDSNGEIIQFPETYGSVFDELDKAKADLEDAEARKADAENKIKGFMGENEIGLCASHKVTWRTINAAGYTVQPKSYRRLTIK